MPINFMPHTGMVLMCDFSSGSVPPEINKVRHVVIISPRRRRHSGTCTIVPFSTVAPNPIEPYHFRIEANRYAFLKKNTDVWVKGDLVTNVSFARLDRVLENGRYVSPRINQEDLQAIRLAVWEGLGRIGSMMSPVA